MKRLLLPSLLVLGSVSAGCALDISGGGNSHGSGSNNAPVVPKPGTGGACLPQSVFQNAVCLCGDFSHAGSLVTERASGGGAANVGVNGSFAAATGTHIEGTLWSFGEVAMAGELNVDDDLLTGNDLKGAGSLVIGRDATIQRSVSIAGELSVGGVLRAGGDVVVAGSQSVASIQPFSGVVDSPCECDPHKRLDVASRVAAQGPGVDGSGVLDIGPGAHVFNSLVLSKMNVTGAAQVYVAGDIVSIGDGQIDIQPGATLELFVAGNVSTVGSVTLGDPAHPEAFRLYVGGSDTVTVSSAGSMAYSGLIYAPDAEISFAGDANVSGALFARSLSYAGTLDVRFAGAPPPDDCKGNGADGGSDASADSPDAASAADGGASHEAGSCL